VDHGEDRGDVWTGQLLSLEGCLVDVVPSGVAYVMIGLVDAVMVDAWFWDWRSMGSCLGLKNIWIGVQNYRTENVVECGELLNRCNPPFQ